MQTLNVPVFIPFISCTVVTSMCWFYWMLLYCSFYKGHQHMSLSPLLKHVHVHVHTLGYNDFDKMENAFRRKKFDNPSYVWWLYATLLVYLFSFITIHTFIQSFIHSISPGPISISLQLQAPRAEPPRGAETRFELGSALQQAIWAMLHPISAALHPIWATLHPILATLHSVWVMLHPVWATLHPLWAMLHPIWATLHPLWDTLYPLWAIRCTLSEIRCTLSELLCILSELRCTPEEKIWLSKKPFWSRLKNHNQNKINVNLWTALCI